MSKAMKAAIITLAVAASILWGTVALEAAGLIELPWKTYYKWERTIPMFNQHITWEGAGYNGIYGGK